MLNDRDITLFGDILDTNGKYLIDEVEIIEEDEEIDKLNWFKNDMKYVSGEPDIESVINIILDMQDKINEIIDKLNEMEKE